MNTEAIAIIVGFVGVYIACNLRIGTLKDLNNHLQEQNQFLKDELKRLHVTVIYDAGSGTVRINGGDKQ